MRIQDVATGLLQFIDERQQFLTAAHKGAAFAMTPAQHLEVAQLLLNPERLIRVLDLNRESPQPESAIDLVGTLDAFYVGLAHLGAAYGVRWTVTDRESEPIEASGDVSAAD